jgi:hypothetical protein
MLLAVTMALVAVPHSTGKVAPTTLQDLASGSSAIVLGKVRAVLEIAGVRVAILSVEEVLKGQRTGEIAFLAQGTWRCDIAWAEPGERSLYFFVAYELDPEPDPLPRDPDVWNPTFKEPTGFREGVDDLGLPMPLMAIRWAGRGRMPVRLVHGHEYVTLWVDDVKLPAGVATINGPKRKYDFIRSIRLADARNLVLKWVGENE